MSLRANRVNPDRAKSIIPFKAQPTRTSPLRIWFLCVAFVMTALALACSFTIAQQQRKVVIDEAAAGPAGTDLQGILVFIQSSKVDPLGITVVTGDQWRDEEVAHTLRLLEIIHRTGILLVPGTVYPLVRTIRGTQLWEERYGKIEYQGAWTPHLMHPHS